MHRVRSDKRLLDVLVRDGDFGRLYITYDVTTHDRQETIAILVLTVPIVFPIMLAMNFDPIWSHPKPRQKPHPPIFLGGHGTKALERVVRYCDGWMPLGPLVRDFGHSIRTLRELATKAGRDPRSIAISAMSAPADEKTIASWAEAGVDRVVFPLAPAPADKILPKLDQYAKLVSR